MNSKSKLLTPEELCGPGLEMSEGDKDHAYALLSEMLYQSLYRENRQLELIKEMRPFVRGSPGIVAIVSGREFLKRIDAEINKGRGDESSKTND